MLTIENRTRNLTLKASLVTVSTKQPSFVNDYSEGLSETSVKFRWLRVKLLFLTITNLKLSMCTLSHEENKPGCGDNMTYALTYFSQLQT